MANEPLMPALTVRAICATPVLVPLTYALGTSADILRQVPLLLVDVETEEGVTGRAYLFCYVTAAAAGIAGILGEIEARTKSVRIVPDELWAKLSKRFTLIGVQGIVRMAMAAFDVACWDALADEAEKLLGGGFKAMKLRLGYPTLQEDIAAVHAVRKRIGDAILLMVDYNQALSVEKALVRGRALDAENIYWLEEPIRHDDYAGAARLARELKVPIQIGENFSLVTGMAAALEHGKPDYVMPDLERIGGVSGWRRAAELAAVNRIEMSSHLFSEASAHLLAATPTCHFLEYVDWLNVLVEEPLAIVDGHAVPSKRPGSGIVWKKDAVEHFRMR